MPEKETVFSSKIAYGGVFSFKELYKFCYEWLTEETGLSVSETKYEEKIAGEAKNIVVKWLGEKKVTDYFKYEVEVSFGIDGLTNVEINQGGAKVNTNKGKANITVKGNLIRDYDGKFEGTAFKKYLRGSYEKWVIPARVGEYTDKLSQSCDEFLAQTKAYLDLEGKK